MVCIRICVINEKTGEKYYLNDNEEICHQADFANYGRIINEMNGKF